MAGKRQHYIPRFLQRGFLAEEGARAERTWLHRREASAQLVGIRDVGVGEYFYSRLPAVGGSSLDDAITAAEGEFDQIVRALRQAPLGRLSDSRSAARLTAHLSLRTAHIRRTFEQGFAEVVEFMNDLARDSESMRAQLKVDHEGPTDFNRQVAQEVRRALSVIAEVPETLLNQMVAYRTRETFEQFFSEASPVIVSALEQVSAGIATTVQDGHNAALSNADQTQWEDDLSGFCWSIHEVTGAILADCVALGMNSGGAVAPLPFVERGEIQTVLFPVAHDRLLIGARTNQPELSIEEVNRHSALCSDNFFVASTPQDNLDLASLIGRRSAEVIDDAVADAIREIRTGGPELAPVPNARRLAQERGEQFSFSVTCRDFADQELAESIGQILNVVVGEMSRQMPLNHLDGFTFAVDYPAALLDLDRGDPDLGADRSEPRDYGTAVAKCVSVVRKDEVKQHVVAQAGIAMGLLADERTLRSSCIHVIVGKLADAAHVVVAEEGLRTSEVPAITALNRHLHVAVAGAPSRYFTARASAFVDPEAGARYAELVVASLSSARATVLAARRQFRVDGQIEPVLHVALQQVRFVLDHTAEWLGHRDGLPDQTPPSDHALADKLVPLGLQFWLELLGRDLAQIYSERGNFTHTSLFALDRHVERLLWTMLICPWVMPDGNLFVSVLPGGED